MKRVHKRAMTSVFIGLLIVAAVVLIVVSLNSSGTGNVAREDFLNPTIRSGTISVNSSLTGSDVYINSIYVGKAPIDVEVVPRSHAYLVEVRARGSTYSKDIFVTRDRVTKVFADFARAGIE